MAQIENIDAIRKDIAAIIPAKDWDDGSLGPLLVRLAWHASGTYDKDSDTGGSSGAGMRYENEGGDPANAGLQHARVALEPIKKKYPQITYSDLWTLAGVVAIKEMGGPDIEWKGGRTDFDNESFCPPRGRLPDGAQAADHLRDVFYRMGFDDKDIVTLSGAHALGRCHPDRSGFDGPWSITPTRFSNSYYKMLTQLEWKKRDWEGPFQYHNDDLGESLMMLPTDYSLIQDEKFKPWVEKYAKDKDLFFDEFAKVFGRLIELGVKRDENGYKSAPKKSDKLGAPDHGDGLGHKNAGQNKAKL
ncbi:cytochrome c peroxidase [Microbotryomycetes sp. NB124-2]